MRVVFPHKVRGSMWPSNYSKCLGQRHEYRTRSVWSADPNVRSFEPPWQSPVPCADRRYHVFGPYRTSTDDSGPAIQRCPLLPVIGPAVGQPYARFLPLESSDPRCAPCQYHARAGPHRLPCDLCLPVGSNWQWAALLPTQHVRSGQGF